MKSQMVFQEEKEIDRLAVQNRLLLSYETPIFGRIFTKGSDLRVLDVGCNDGKKTVMRFSSQSVAKVIGLEYNELLAKQAQTVYGGEKFSFYHIDAEGPGFEEELRLIMERDAVAQFDVIYLSFLLMHLRDPERFLRSLRRFLAPGGNLVIVEANDGASVLIPQEGDLLTDFLEILKKDPLSGNREFGQILPQLLGKCGYDDITLWHDAIGAEGEEREKKQDIFTTFFSYLPEDVSILQKQYPDNGEYKQWATWLDGNYEKLEKTILHQESTIRMGMRVLTCRTAQEIVINDEKTRFFLYPMEKADVAQALELCDQCVGENLYTKEMLEAAIEDPNRFFCLLKTATGEIAGYIYYLLDSVKDMAEVTGLDEDLLCSAGCKAGEAVGKIQSVGVAAPYRGSGLAAQMMQYALKQLCATEVGVAFIVCWKTGDVVPLRGALNECGFDYLASAGKIWYNIPELVCPYCGGRCECNAEVYFKSLNEGEIL